MYYQGLFPRAQKSPNKFSVFVEIIIIVSKF